MMNNRFMKLIILFFLMFISICIYFVYSSLDLNIHSEGSNKYVDAVNTENDLETIRQAQDMLIDDSSHEQVLDKPDVSERSIPDSTDSFDFVANTNIPFYLFIHDSSMNPIQGATVSLLDASSTIVDSTSSQADGHAVLSHFRKELYSANEPLAISIQKKEYFDWNKTIEKNHLSIEKPLDITLHKKMSITGVVITKENELLPDITIIRTRGDNDFQYPNLAPHQVVSSTKGTFRFDPLPNGRYVLEASDSHWLGEKQSVVAGDENVKIIVSQESSLTVSVRSTQGKPVLAALVHIISATYEPFHYTAQENTGLNGTAVFKKLKRGDYSITARHDWYLDSEPVPVSICQSKQNIDVVLQDRNYSISGVVLEAKSKKPVASAPVVCALKHDIGNHEVFSSTRTTISQEDGAFLFENLTGGIYALYVDSMTGYITGTPRNYMFGSAPPLQIPLGEKTDNSDVILYVKKCWSVTGHVYDEVSKKPLPEVQVFLKQNYASKAYGRFQIATEEEAIDRSVTDAHGYYELIGNVEIADCRGTVLVMAKKDGYTSKESKEFQPQPDEEVRNVDIYIKKGVVLDGIVNGEEGNPIEDAMVYFEGMDSSYSFFVYTDSQGKYSYVLEPNRFELQATADECLPSDKIIVDLKMAGERYTQNFTLKKGGRIIQGIVTDSDENPISNVFIYVNFISNFGNDPSNPNGAISDGNGLFSIHLMKSHAFLRDKQFSLIATEDYRYKPTVLENIDLSQSFFHIVMEEKDRLGGVTGTIVDKNGFPAQNFNLIVLPSGNIRNHFTNQSEHPLFFWTPIYNPEGKFIVNDLPIEGNPYLIAARRDESPAFFSEPIRLQPGVYITDVILILDGGVTIIGWIVDPNTNQPRSGITVHFTPKLPDPVSFGEMTRGYQYIGRPVTEQIQPIIVQSNQEGVFQIYNAPSSGGYMLLEFDKNRKEIEVQPVSHENIFDMGTILF